MPRFKRSSFSFFTIEKNRLLDVKSFLAGQYDISEVTSLFALSPLNASTHALELQDLERLLKIPDDSWTSCADLCKLGMDSDWLEKMSRKGLLLSDRDDPSLRQMKRRAEVLESEQWHPWAAFYHFMIRGTESGVMQATFDHVSVAAQSQERARQFLAKHGPPPSPFKSVRAEARVELPLIDKKGALYDLLSRRKTSRIFDIDARTSAENVATLLHYGFGWHGYMHLVPEVLMIHRTSPSGGSRHPIEVYPLVLRVDGLAVGLYHYDMQNHALEFMREYDLDEAQEAAIGIAGGQTNAGTAHVLFIMTARYYRNHWKYRRRGRTYSVILMDAAHLSQTLYLIAEELGLGAFFSANLDAPMTDSFLGLDGYEEGAIAVFGCGVPSARTEYSLPFRPAIPRKTKV